jgi:DNA-directed RNA polymerase
MIKEINWSGGCLDAPSDIMLDDAIDALHAVGWLETNQQGELLLSPEKDGLFNEIVFELATQDEANYEPTAAPYVWETARQDLKSLVPAGHPSMLGHYNKAQGVMAAVNKMQAVGYTADPALLEIADIYTWLSENREGDGDSLTRRVQFNKYQSYIKQDRTLFFTQTLDFRGRMYYRGLLNPSNLGDFGKAAFQFAEQKPVGQGAYKALSIHYANVAGKDKMSIKARLAWASKHGEALAEAIKEKTVAEIQEITGEKKIFCLYTAAHEWLRVTRSLKLGQSVTSGYIVRQDGKCNGVQHGAALAKCQTTAINVSLVAQTETETPADIYRVFLDALVAKIGHDHGGLITRDFCKDPVMTRGYGAGRQAIQNSMYRKLEKAQKLEYTVPRQMLMGLLVDTVDDEGEEMKSVLMNLIMATLDEVIAGMAMVTETLREALKDRAAQALSTYWKTADGFPVRVEGEVLHSNCFDILHLEQPNWESDQFYNKRWVVRNEEEKAVSLELSERATIKGIAPNFVHSIDGNHVRAIVMETAADIVHTHDDIGTHAADYFAVNSTVRRTFVGLHTQFDWMGSLEQYSEVNVKRLTGGYDVTEALKATYMFS